MDYFKGILFIVGAIIFLSNLGGRIVNKKENFSKRLLVGYVLYSVLQAMLGIFTQYLGIDFSIYKIAMIVMIILLCIFILYKDAKKIEIRKWFCLLKEHLIKYKIIYILATVLTLASILNLTYLWMGNHQDDGLYLLKVALAPKLGGNYDVSYATGFTETLALSRVINTFELDYAFWSDLLTIYPSIFCKFTMVFLNYFIVLNGFHYAVSKFAKGNTGKAVFLCVILFFAINPETFLNHGIIAQQDAWHFNTAIWYGSGIVRCLGPILLIAPFVGKSTLEWKNVMFFMLSSFALLSKASQALPMIFLAFCAIGLYYTILLCIRKKKIAYLIFIGGLLLLIFIPIPSRDLLSTAMQAFTSLFKTKIFLLACIPLLVIPIWLKDKNMKQFLVLYLLMMAFAMIPRLNSMFLHLSTIEFVVQRTVTMFSFYSIIFAGVFCGFLLQKYSKRVWITQSLYIAFGFVCMGIYLVSLSTNYGVNKTIRVLASNTKLIPESTVLLSNHLEELAGTYDDKLYALGPSWVNIDGFSHVLGTTLRVNAKSIYSISAIHRFPNMTENSPFKSFDLVKQTIFEDFCSKPITLKNKNKMRELLEEYPINVIYTTRKETNVVLEKEFEYHLVDVVKTDKTYYILINENVYKNLKHNV